MIFLYPKVLKSPFPSSLPLPLFIPPDWAMNLSLSAPCGCDSRKAWGGQLGFLSRPGLCSHPPTLLAPVSNLDEGDPFDRLVPIRCDSPSDVWLSISICEWPIYFGFGLHVKQHLKTPTLSFPSQSCAAWFSAFRIFSPFFFGGK